MMMSNLVVWKHFYTSILPSEACVDIGGGSRNLTPLMHRGGP